MTTTNPETTQLLKRAADTIDTLIREVERNGVNGDVLFDAIEVWQDVKCATSPVTETLQIDDIQDADPWNLLVHVLSPRNATLRNCFSPEARNHAYELCDGFGPHALIHGWDWSHVRDSSDEAKERAAEFLKSVARGDISSRRGFFSERESIRR